jgi:hypothetical protein
MTVHDLTGLAGWVAGGLLVSFRHARRAGASTTARSE